MKSYFNTLAFTMLGVMAFFFILLTRPSTIPGKRDVHPLVHATPASSSAPAIATR